MISNISQTLPPLPHEITEYIARRARAKRLALNFSQQSLSERSGVSFGVIKKFERTGKISLESLLKIASVLNCSENFAELFKPIATEKFPTMNELLKQKTRLRGRE